MDNNQLDRLIAQAWQERMSRRRFLRLSGLGMGAIALGPLLAACGQRGGGQGPATAAPTITTLDPPAGNVTLEFWNPFTGPDGPFMARLVDQFNTENPTVQVNVTTQAEYDTQLRNAAQSNALPQLLIARVGGGLALYAADGFISPVDDLVSLLGLGPEDFTEAVWNGTFWKDQQFAIPLDIHTFTFFVNRALFEEVGLDPDSPPTDEESFVAALQSLNDGGITGPVWSNHGFSLGLFWASLFYQGGGEWTTEDYSEATYNDEAGVNAAQFLRDQVEAGLHPEGVEVDAEIPSFADGQSGMVVAGIWQTARFAEALGDDLWAGPIPQIFGRGVWAGSHQLAVSAGVDGDERQAAYYFINWVTERAHIWAEGGQLPARVSARESPEFAELEHISTIAEQIDDARFFPTIPAADDVLFGPGGANEAVTTVVAEGADAQSALDTSAEQYTGIFQETVEEYGL